MTISQSCKKELQWYGISNVSIIPMAVDFEEEQIFLQKKEDEPTLIFVGRIIPSKKVLDCIESFNIAKQKIPRLKLWVIGNGDSDYLAKLKKRVKELHLDKEIRFWGKVTQEEKYSLMAKAHLIVVSSVKEGWGLIVTEANAVKTPAVVYNVTGLKDAVKNNITGLVCEQNNPTNMADKILSFITNKDKYENLQNNAYQWSKELTWDKTSKKGLEIVEKLFD